MYVTAAKCGHHDLNRTVNKSMRVFGALNVEFEDLLGPLAS